MHKSTFSFQNVRLSSELRKKSVVPIDDNSLSIVKSLDVLRNRLLLEVARKKTKYGANRNRMMLFGVGKRSENYPLLF